MRGKHQKTHTLFAFGPTESFSDELTVLAFVDDKIWGNGDPTRCLHGAQKAHPKNRTRGYCCREVRGVSAHIGAGVLKNERAVRVAMESSFSLEDYILDIKNV